MAPPCDDDGNHPRRSRLVFFVYTQTSSTQNWVSSNGVYNCTHSATCFVRPFKTDINSKIGQRRNAIRKTSTPKTSRKLIKIATVKWMVISTGVVEASSVGVGRCAYRICFQPSPLNSLTAKSERSK